MEVALFFRLRINVMMGRKQKLTAGGYDVLYGKKFYCYLKRPGVSKKIKCEMNKRTRRELKKELKYAY